MWPVIRAQLPSALIVLFVLPESSNLQSSISNSPRRLIESADIHTEWDTKTLWSAHGFGSWVGVWTQTYIFMRTSARMLRRRRIYAIISPFDTRCVIIAASRLLWFRSGGNQAWFMFIILSFAALILWVDLHGRNVPFVNYSCSLSVL